MDSFSRSREMRSRRLSVVAAIVLAVVAVLATLRAVILVMGGVPARPPASDLERSPPGTETTSGE